MDTRKQVRRIAVPAVVSLGTYVADTGGNVEPLDLALWLMSTTGAGAVVFAAIELAEKWIRRPLPSTIKFYTAMAGSALVPVGTYLLFVGLELMVYSWARVLGCILVGYQVSQTVHFETVPPPKPD